MVAVAQGFAVDEMRAAMDELKGEEKVLAEEIAVCQPAEEQSVKLNVDLVKSYVSSFADLVPELTPEELKEFLQRNLRIEWDLQNQGGQLYLKLTPDNRRGVNLNIEPPRKPYGRSHGLSRIGFGGSRSDRPERHAPRFEVLPR